MILPSVTRVLRTNQNLYVYLESYPPEAREAGGLGGKSRSFGRAFRGCPRFLPRTVKTSEAGRFTGQVESSSKDQTQYLVKIPLDQFPPGRYWMQVNVLDPLANRAAFARLPLAVMRASAPSGPGGY